VLCIPSLQIAAGEKVAIIAEDTAGKSTLARLLTRFYDAIRETSAYMKEERRLCFHCFPDKTGTACVQ